MAHRPSSVLDPARPSGRPVSPLPAPVAPPADAPGLRAPQSARTAAKRSRGGFWVVAIPVAALVGLSLYWASYYGAVRGERVRHPLHPWLKPSGYLGQTAGILAVLIFFFLWLYPLRKKVRWLRWTGAMSAWLDVHIAAALVLPMLTAVHAAWRFEGLIGLGFWSMMVVCASGVIGRYLYVHIPRSASGLELTADEIAGERKILLGQLARTSGLPLAQVDALLQSDPTPCDGLGIVGTLRRMAADEVTRWRAAARLREICGNRPGSRLDRRALRDLTRAARREMALTQQVRMLEATHRLFRLWHVAHRPFAVAAMVAVLVHVGVVVSMGMTWFW